MKEKIGGESTLHKTNVFSMSNWVFENLCFYFFMRVFGKLLMAIIGIVRHSLSKNSTTSHMQFHIVGLDCFTPKLHI